MQLLLAANADSATVTSDGFSTLIGKRALCRRRKSLEKGRVEEEVNTKATGAGSRHGMASTVQTGETVQDGDTPAAPPNRGPTAQGWGRRHQKQATWVEVVAAGGAKIPVMFGLLGLNIGKGKPGVRRSRNRRPGTPQKGRMEEGPGGGKWDV